MPKPTLLVVAAVAAVAVAAAADALLPEETERSTPATRPRPVDSAFERAGAELARGGVDGLLLATGEDCRVRAFRLPELDAVAPPELRRCDASGRPLPPVCPKRILVLRARDGSTAAKVSGCVAQARATARPRPHVLTTSDLRKAARGHPYLVGVSSFVEARAAAWLSSARLAVVVGASGRHDGLRLSDAESVAVYDGRRLIGTESFLGERPVDLDVSPRGRYVAVRTSGAGSNLEVLDRHARSLDVPNLPAVRDVAWSPDERWMAAAGDESVWIFSAPPAWEGGADAAGDVAARVFRIPLAASELLWLGP